MKDELKRAGFPITIALIIFLVSGIIPTILLYRTMTDVTRFPGGEFILDISQFERTSMYLIGMLFYAALIMMGVRMFKLFTSSKKTIIGKHTEFGFGAFIGGTGFIVFFMLLIIILDRDITLLNFIDLLSSVGPFIFYPFIHVSIALSTYRIGGKGSFLIIVFLFVICFPLIYFSIMNEIISLTMAVMIIYFLILCVINIISYRKLLRWRGKIPKEVSPSEDTHQT